MKKISEYFSKKENQIETVALFSESQNANNFQDNTHESLLFVQSDDATDSTVVVESPSFTEELIVQGSHLFHQKREENLNKAGMKNINGFYMTARKKKFFVLPALKLPK